MYVVSRATALSRSASSSTFFAARRERNLAASLTSSPWPDDPNSTSSARRLDRDAERGEHARGEPSLFARAGRAAECSVPM